MRPCFSHLPGNRVSRPVLVNLKGDRNSYFKWFTSSQEFADFIALGVSSYGLSRHGSRLTRVDLHKDDANYTPLEVSDPGGAFPDEWQRHGGVFDSAFRTAGGRYEWTYRGLTEESLPREESRIIST